MSKLLGKFFVFTSVFPILHCSIYIKSENSRRNQSATIFNLKGKDREEKNQRLGKRKRVIRLVRIVAPTILVKQTSSLPTNTPRGFNVETTKKRPFPRGFNVESTLRVSIGGNELTETSFSRFTSLTDTLKEIIAIKLNLLKDKSIRCEYHKDLLSHCLAEKLVPKCLRLKLELKIGNCNEEVINTWYAPLKPFHLH